MAEVVSEGIHVVVFAVVIILGVELGVEEDVVEAVATGDAMYRACEALIMGVV
jgi:hypothetical protein